jgi:PDDEXK-like domain of unknown function (DUF3799)
MRELDNRVHWSTLKNIGRSPAHYIEALRSSREQSAAMRFGSAVHSIVLGGGSTIAVWERDRRGNEWKCFEEDNRGKLILTAKEHADVIRAAHAVMSHDGAMRLLTGRREQRIEWTRNGVECAGTPDVVGAEYITELKTTTNAEPNWFMRHAKQMGYVGQLAWYAHAAKRTRGAIVAVESKAPFAVTLFIASERIIEEGDKLCTKYLELFKQCEASGLWGAYSDAPVEFEATEYDLDFGEEEAAE